MPNEFTSFAVLLISLPGRHSDQESQNKYFFTLPTTLRAIHFYRETGKAVNSSCTIVEMCRVLRTIHTLQ